MTPQGERQLNRGQVAAGWARVYVYDGRPFDQLEAFRAAEQGGRRAGRVCGPGAAVTSVARQADLAQVAARP